MLKVWHSDITQASDWGFSHSSICQRYLIFFIYFFLHPASFPLFSVTWDRQQPHQNMLHNNNLSYNEQKPVLDRNSWPVYAGQIHWHMHGNKYINRVGHHPIFAWEITNWPLCPHKDFIFTIIQGLALCLSPSFHFFFYHQDISWY